MGKSRRFFPREKEGERKEQRKSGWQGRKSKPTGIARRGRAKAFSISFSPASSDFGDLGQAEFCLRKIKIKLLGPYKGRAPLRMGDSDSSADARFGLHHASLLLEAMMDSRTQG